MKVLDRIKRCGYIYIVLLIIIGTSSYAFAQNVLQFKSYFPEPVGGFKTLRIADDVAPPDPCPQGTLYFHSRDVMGNIETDLMYCYDEDGPGPGTPQATKILDYAWELDLINNYLYAENMNYRVGIGTATPPLRLSIDNGGILSKGTYGSGLALPALGAGTRFMWLPKKATFYSGYSFASKWNDADIGESSVVFGYNNVAESDYSVIVGGQNNTISDDFGVLINGEQGIYTTILGQEQNYSRGSANVIYGSNNNIRCDYCSFGGSRQTTSVMIEPFPVGITSSCHGWDTGNNEYCSVSSDYSTMGGGINHKITALAHKSAIFGGNANEIWRVGPYDDDDPPGDTYFNSFIGGGTRNTIYTKFAAIVGGDTNTITAYNGQNSIILGGKGNTIESTDAGVRKATAIGGGEGNTADAHYSIILGGSSNQVSGDYVTIGGGWNNQATGNLSTIGGGKTNQATATHATVGGGEDNLAGGDNSFVAGGKKNVTFKTGDTKYGAFATILGGESNYANGDYSFIGGGKSNTATGDYAAIPGGLENYAAGYNSLALGYRARSAGNSSLAVSQATANQYLSFAMGGTRPTSAGSATTQAADNYAFSFGPSAISSSVHSVAFGNYVNSAASSGSTYQGYAYSFGANITTSGAYATAFGSYLTADSSFLLAIGRFNELCPGGTCQPGAWENDDPIFEIAIGADAASRKNAVTILKNGNTGFGVYEPKAVVHIDNILRLEPRATSPFSCAGLVEGTIYMDTTDGGLCYCDGSNWVAMPSAGICS